MQNVKIISIISVLFVFSIFSFFVLAQDKPSTIPFFEVCQGIACNPQVSNTRMVNENGISQTLFKRGTFVRIHMDIVDPGGIKYARAIVKNVDGDVETIIPLYNDGSENHGDASSYLNGSINGADDDTYSALWLTAYIFRTEITYRLVIEASDNFGHIYYSNPYELEFSLTDAYSSNCSNIGELKCVDNLIQKCFHNVGYDANIWQVYIDCAPKVCCGDDPNVICCLLGQVCVAGVCISDNDGDGHGDILSGGDDCDDNNPNRFPGNPEICDGLDNDCDSSITDETVCDSDHDDSCNCNKIFVFGSDLSAICPKTNTTDSAAIINTCDCDDGNVVVYSGANELCNGIDDDCDGQVDEGDVCVFENNLDFNQGDNVNIIPNQNWLEIKPIATPYIWLASSGSNSVYRVNSSDNSVAGPFPVGVSPSRTAVAINGDVWIANRNSANVTHLDTNGALIKTCSVGSGPRGVAVDADGNVWVGNYGDGTVQKLDYDTCAILEEYTLPNPTATSLPGVYGMAVDGLGNIWMVNGHSSHRDLAKIEISTKTVTTYSFDTHFYGIALDKHNNVWLANWSGKKVYKIDQSGNVMAEIPLGMNCRAIACDKDNNIWVTHSNNDKVTKLDNDGNVIFSVCTDPNLDCDTTTGAKPIGVTATASGYIWVVNYSTHIASKIDPDTGNIVASADVGLQPYTYSDMAGYMLRTVTLGGKWTLKVDSKLSNPQWETLDWNEIEPDDSYARVRVRSADTELDLDLTVWSDYYDSPPVDISAFAGHTWLQVQFDMKYSINDESPTVDNISIGF